MYHWKSERCVCVWNSVIEHLPGTCKPWVQTEKTRKNGQCFLYFRWETSLKKRPKKKKKKRKKSNRHILWLWHNSYWPITVSKRVCPCLQSAHTLDKETEETQYQESRQILWIKMGKDREHATFAAPAEAVSAEQRSKWRKCYWRAQWYASRLAAGGGSMLGAGAHWSRALWGEPGATLWASGGRGMRSREERKGAGEEERR